ncbi:MAG: hypothetical protein LBS22_01370 [Puniceicoccales bacterium]|jgi:hypothetical protein|nr:hypothetical protein [Puniceicoccales bacterium]
MKWRDVMGDGEIELRVQAENETYNVFKYEIDEKVFIQNENHCVKFDEALSSFEENTEVYCDWLQTLAEN